MLDKVAGKLNYHITGGHFKATLCAKATANKNIWLAVIQYKTLTGNLETVKEFFKPTVCFWCKWWLLFPKKHLCTYWRIVTKPVWHDLQTAEAVAKSRLTFSPQLRTTCAPKKASNPNYIHVEYNCGVAKEERPYIIASLHNNLIASECVYVTVYVCVCVCVAIGPFL